jgi:hypothetical protein
MKKLLFGIALVAGLASCEHRVSTYALPDPVENSFRGMYPEASKVRWERRGKVYEAKFKMQNHRWEAKFREDGKFLKENG